MARARPRKRKKSRVAAAPRPSAAETRLLTLALELTALARDEASRETLPAALHRLAAAYGPSAPLPRDLCQAWLRGRADKTRALALAWAREQVRLALQEVLERGARGARARAPLPPESLAWLLVAGCEALAHEPPGAAADRLRVLLEVTGLGDRSA